MSNSFEDTELTAKALELERFLPEGRQAEFRMLVAAMADEAARNSAQADETVRLREHARRLGGQLKRLQDIFRGNDQAFATFRSALTLSRRLRRMDELPDMLAELSRAMGVTTLTCLLSRELFAAFVPEGFPCPAAKSLTAAINALPRADPARRVYVGPIAALPRPDFFFQSGRPGRTAATARGLMLYRPPGR
ncbi:hypothetical protein DVDV_1079 [Desulfovibrio sp. DV]|uniref:hypothetical protein n=1 Tax=Desulfovibrio sp. DV TaxID=1844708 RepID=UPI000966BE87|nr:hypothetical protein [Desulfovibrio sp. DV]OLN29567.1 hypothetical protein DVDV_1079 [Desulfovibrio sp. DV]